MGKSGRKRQKLLSAAESEAWPTFKSTQEDWISSWKVFSNNSLLSNLDESLWIALGHVEPETIESEGCLLAVRSALRKIGLGWVCNNTTYLRGIMAQYYKMAKKFYESNGYKPPKNLHEIPVQEIEVRDWQWTPKHGIDSAGMVGTEYTNKDGYLEFIVTRKDRDVIPSVIANQIHSSIRETGMTIIRGAVDKATIEQLQSDQAIYNSHRDAAKLELAKNRIKLRDTSGSGMAGEESFEFIKEKGKQEIIGSFYCGINQSTYLDQLQDILLMSLKLEGGKEPQPKKYIYLKYSKEGENWAHRDANKDEVFPYQALLMLSSSDGYDGGEFYVARQVIDIFNKSAIDRVCSPKLDAGDLVIFQAGKDGGYDHGMKKVTRGERVAIGLLQPK